MSDHPHTSVDNVRKTRDRQTCLKEKTYVEALRKACIGEARTVSKALARFMDDMPDLEANEQTIASINQGACSADATLYHNV